ncbi:MAG TPA: hypothetical protein VMV48_13755 [Gallionellaceae bacterium]|nr:hypothetical protein [Gallionellaceae bacterium]
MSTYHQIGHDSESMVVEAELRQFSGAILSPVNYSLNDTIAQCARFRSYKTDFDIIFDPQLYVPSVSRGKLQHWPHKPSDIDTADQSSLGWWKGTALNIIDVCKSFNPAGLCSPAFVPRTFDDAYYNLLVDIGDITAQQLKIDVALKDKTRPFLTALVGLPDLGRNERYLQVGSILSRFSGKDIYLVFVDEEKPRNERSDSGALEGAARLIRVLSQSGFRITVGFTSSEMVLWKAAGAANVATGKFFNLRRFTKGRWDEEESSGGKNISYWFEPALLAFIREADVRRYMKEFPIDPSHDTNPFSKLILENLDAPERKAWVKESWRQFLYWFSYSEALIGNDFAQSSGMVSNAVDTWHAVKDAKLRFEEERNNGDWVRAWDIVLNELDRRPG